MYTTKCRLVVCQGCYHAKPFATETEDAVHHFCSSAVYMPPICSPFVMSGRLAEEALVVSKQLSDTILSSGMINLKDLSLVSGKTAWMAYLDMYCLDADGSLFDAALLAAVATLLAAVAAFSHLRIPIVSLNEEGRVVVVSEENASRGNQSGRRRTRE